MKTKIKKKKKYSVQMYERVYNLVGEGVECYFFVIKNKS